MNKTVTIEFDRRGGSLGCWTVCYHAAPSIKQDKRIQRVKQILDTYDYMLKPSDLEYLEQYMNENNN